MATSQAPAQPPLVGRHAELARTFDSLAAGRGVLVLGEAGIGKSRFVREVLARLAAQGLATVANRCYEAMANVQFYPLRHAAHPILAASGKPEARLGSGALCATAEDFRAELVLEVAGRLTAGHSETVISFDDIQWADVGTLLVVNHLLDDPTSSTKVVCAARTGNVTPGASYLLKEIEEKSTVVRLGPLSLAEARALLAAVCGRGSLREAEVVYLHTLAGGNPFVLTHLGRHVVEGGALRTMTAPAVLQHKGLPDGVARLVEGRLSRLPPESRDVLCALSVFGRPATPGQLSLLTGRRPEVVEEALFAAAGRGFIEWAGSGVVSFTHPIDEKLVHDGMRLGERRSLHRKVLSLAERELVALTAAERATHFGAAFPTAHRAERRKAHEDAAEEAEHAFAFESAASFWRRACALSELSEGRVSGDLHRRLGNAERMAGNWEAALAALERSYQSYLELGCAAEAAEVALSAGELSRLRLDRPQAEQWLERSIRLAPETGTAAPRGMALLGNLKCLSGEVEAGAVLLGQALSRARRDRPCFPEVSFWAASGYAVLGDHEAARGAAREGLTTAREIGDAEGVAQLASLLVQGELSRLRAAEAKGLLELLVTGQTGRSASQLARRLLSVCLVLGYEGRWNLVLDVCDRWAAEVRLAGRFQVATVRMVWGEALLALGRPEAASALMELALPDLETLRAAGGLHLARAAFALGRAERARQLVSEYADEVLATRRNGAARVLLGELACLLDDRRLAGRVEAALGQESLPLPMVYSPISLGRVRGMLAALRGDWQAAFDLLSRTVGELEEGGAVWELIKSHQVSAEARAARGRKGDRRHAEAHLARANQLLVGLGLPDSQEDGRGDLPPAHRCFGLSAREVEVLLLVARGQRNQEIAETLGVSIHTVTRHLENIFAKMGVVSRTQAVVEAVQAGLVTPGVPAT
jgi:DNA-binding CsgD family transcriptional regulator